MQLVERTLQALTILSQEREGLSVSELAERLGIPASSTHRVLACLKNNHFVSQDESTKKYRIGYKVLTLCANITQESAFTRTARPHMQKLAAETGKTVTLCVMEGDHSICLDYIESKDTSMFYVRTGFAMPPHATSSGKAMLAHMPESEVRALLERVELDRLTANTKLDAEELLAELKQVRDQGYALSDEELQLGVQGAASPVFDSNDRVIGSVSFTALKADGFINETSLPLLKNCAAQISRSLGNTTR